MIATRDEDAARRRIDREQIPSARAAHHVPCNFFPGFRTGCGGRRGDRQRDSKSKNGNSHNDFSFDVSWQRPLGYCSRQKSRLQIFYARRVTASKAKAIANAT